MSAIREKRALTPLQTLQRVPLKQWREEQIVAILYTNARGAMLGSIAIIMIAASVLSQHFPGHGIWLWCSAGLLINATRWLVHLRFIRSPDSRPNHDWLTAHRLLTFCSGCLYGSMALLFFSSSDPLYQMMVIFLVGGMGAAAVGTHGIDMPTYRLFLFACVLPMIIRALLEQTPVHNGLALMLLLLTGIMLRSARQTREIMMENIDMSFSLHYRATHDGLVGLLNRDEFYRLYEHTIAHPRHSSPVVTALIFLDLDNFKVLNDSFGHKAGDEALVKIGEIIRSAVRHDDIAARFGGDEFMILLQGHTVDDAYQVAQKIQQGLQAYVTASNYTDAGLGASIGIGYSHARNPAHDALLAAADRACYQAKHGGKGSIASEEI